VIDGQARGIVVRNMDTGGLERHGAHAVVLATGGFGKIYYLSTLAMACNASAIWRAHKRGAFFANPSWTQIHPTCLPQSGEYQSKLTLMSESLRNDGRIWVPKRADEKRNPGEISESERDYYLERRYPSFGNLAPRDISSRAAKERIDAGYGVGPLKNAVYLDFSRAISEQGMAKIQEKYGNLFRMYEKITGINAYKEPMRISPAAHFSMGGLWVDYELMTTIPGLYAVGEANFADHVANRLGANSQDGLKKAIAEIRSLRDQFSDYDIADVSPDMSFLEMLDLLNDRLIRQGERPVEFDHDCREGICGQCGVMINGRASAALFTAAKIVHLALLPQGKIEARQRVQRMVAQMDREGFGHCSNTEACQVECPQEISVLNIARMNWEYNRALLS